MYEHALAGEHRARVGAIEPANDHSASFKTVRAGLVHADGRNYQEFVRALKPVYATVWRDIALGYGMLILGCVAMVGGLAMTGESLLAAIVVAMLGTLHIGYWVAYLQLFIHEGAHHNLAADRSTNDRICNGLIGWMVGSTVADYRTVHFQHHRALGTVGDSEFTYFFPLNLMFFVKGLFGIRVLEVLRARRTCVATGSPKKKAGSIEQNGSQLAFAGILAHLGIAGGLWFAGGVFAAVAWLVGVCSIFPLFGALRQLLEHRDDHADDTTDYARSNHGAYTRLFGSGPFSATFGGAGFNRHLLHHWEPQVSYTQLGVLEEFLLGTEMRRVIEMRRSSYGGAALKLLSLR